MSAAAPNRIIAVVGATGAQGGGVVRHLLGSGWKIRALTRQPNHSKSQALLKTNDPNIEVVDFDMDDRQSIERAFDGVEVVYAVTVPSKNVSEFEQGKRMADVAKEKGVKTYIWSSLENVEAITNNKYHVPHFTSKNRVEQYCHEIHLPTIALYPGFYIPNFANIIVPKRGADGVAEFSVALRSDVAVPLFDPADTGIYVRKLLENVVPWIGKRVLTGQYVTMPQIVQQYTQATGDPARYQRLPIELVRSFAGGDVADMFEYFNHYGYYNGEDLTPHIKEFPGVTTWPSWLEKTGWKAPSASDN